MYNKVKKQNGERFAKTIRNYHSGIFEIPNLLRILKYAGNEAEPVIPYLVSLLETNVDTTTGISIEEGFEKAGYDFLICEKDEDIDSFKKFYAEGEVLCTFSAFPSRLESNYVIFATKKNIATIKRENFSNPLREDEYGTSCISIQLAKSGGFISIKNRYNHTVPNCDNTFGSNPDLIHKGLTKALEKKFNISLSSYKVAVPNGYALAGSCIVKTNYEVNGVFFGEKCYVKNGCLIELNPDHEIMLDYFVLDTKARVLHNPSETTDAFVQTFQKILDSGEPIILTKN